MRMGAHVDRHAVDRDGKIGAVIEIESAQEILIGLPVSAVLGDDQAGHHFECFRRPGQWPGVDVGAADIFLARRCGRDRSRRAPLRRDGGITGSGNRTLDCGAVRAFIPAMVSLEARVLAMPSGFDLYGRKLHRLRILGRCDGRDRDPTHQQDRATAARVPMHHHPQRNERFNKSR